MFKTLFVLIFFTFFAYAQDFGSMAAYPLVKIDEKRNEAYLNTGNLKKGESGLIIRWFDNSHASIVASMVVVESKDNEAKIAFKVFDALEQDAFPVPLLSPKVNDEVIVRGFYNRALLIAPDQNIYQKVISEYKKMSWIHPDLFAAFLIQEGKNAPSKSDFRRFCDFYSVGLVYMVNMNKGQVVDCQTFTVLHEDYITGRVKDEDTVKPFFSRIGNIENAWLDFITDDVENYYSYYDSLMKSKDSDTEMGLFGTIINYFN